eukprot:8780338-Heterocapsa_arctica.AAC.1
MLPGVDLDQPHGTAQLVGLGAEPDAQPVQTFAGYPGPEWQSEGLAGAVQGLQLWQGGRRALGGGPLS